MGTQGEIHNVLGIITPAILVERDRLYSVNGRTVSTSNYEGRADFIEGDLLGSVEKDNLVLRVRILGHTQGMGSRHFSEGDFEGTKGNALIGYVVANEHYLASATKLLPQTEIDAMKPRLVRDIKDRLGLDVKERDLELYLVYDWDQGDQ
jgi:hypothetical protein